MKNIIIKLFIIMSILITSSNITALENDLDPKNYLDKAKIIIMDKRLENSIKPYPIIEKNKIFKYKTLEITIESCWKSPKDSRENSAMILINEIIPPKRKIKEKQEENKSATNYTEIEEEKIKTIFHGWMFSKNRSVSHIDHEIYQIYLEDCVK